MSGLDIAEVLQVLSQVTEGDATVRIRSTPAHCESNLIGIRPDQLVRLAELLNELLEMSQADQERLGQARNETEELRVALELQRANSKELSTPLIEVWPGVLCLPIIGSIDGTRSLEMTEKVLQAVSTQRTKMVIIDINTISHISAHIAQHLLNLVQAIRLLGAECAISGMQPQIATALVTRGLDISTIRCTRTLYDALTEFLTRQAARQRNSMQQSSGSRTNSEQITSKSRANHGDR